MTRRWLSKIVVATLIMLLCGCGGGSQEQAQIEQIPPIPATMSRTQLLDLAVQKSLTFAQNNAPTYGFPRTLDTETGDWTVVRNDWTNGFFPGILWQLSAVERTGEMERLARKWTGRDLARAAGWQTHDVGFLINDSFGKGLRLTADTTYLDTIQRAAETLSGRFNAQVGATRSWNSDSRFVVIIDNMMNLVLLFEAAKTFNNEAFYQIAQTHMLTTAREFVRDDGGSFHVVEFDENTGSVRRKRTHQGVSDDSTWSRGQAWGIYGFSYAYHETQNPTALSTARKMADFFIDSLPSDGVPFWDFNVEGPGEPKDSSAASIAAAGLWLLSMEVENSTQQQKYRQASLALIDNMLNEQYINTDPTVGPMLRQATGAKRSNTEVDTSLIYADYYLIEALLLQTGLIQRPI